MRRRHPLRRFAVASLLLAGCGSAAPAASHDPGGAGVSGAPATAQPRVPAAACPSGTPAATATPHAVQTPILMYHFIRVNPVRGDTIGYNLSVTPADFAAQMAYLHDHGAHAVSVEEIVNAMQGRGTLPANPVAITFDDGYADFATAAFPVLQRYGLFGEAFVVPGFIGHPNYMSPEQLLTVAEGGTVIGAHTMHHIDLAAASIDTAQAEIDDSRALLRQWTGQPVDDFAYPSGEYDTAVISLVHQGGFRDAVTTDYGWIESPGDEYTLPRVRVRGGESLDAFAAQLPSFFPATPAVSTPPANITCVTPPAEVATPLP